MDFIFSPEVIFYLVLLAAFAGFIDAVAGGGGLLTIPALLLAQVPPINALATNKLQSSFGTFSAALVMIKRGKVDLPSMKIAIATCFTGSVLGTVLIQLSSPAFVNVFVPLVILFICIYFLFAPNPGAVEAKPRVTQKTWQLCCVPALGFYDGYIGPGAGMFYTLAQIALRGREIIAATANSKLLNFISNIASLAVFIAGGKIVWVLGLSMMLGQAVGGYLGAHAVIKGGANFIRPIIVLVCLAMLVKYLSATF